MTKIRKRLLVGAGLTALALIILGSYKFRATYYCQECWSKRDVFQWRLGMWGDASVPLTPAWQSVLQSRFSADFFPTNHIHNWSIAQASPYYFFGTTWAGCAIGAGRHVSEISQMYERSAHFRDFIGAKLKTGSLTKSNLTALVMIHSSDPARTNAAALLDEFFTELNK